MGTSILCPANWALGLRKVVAAESILQFGVAFENNSCLDRFNRQKALPRSPVFQWVVAFAVIAGFHACLHEFDPCIIQSLRVSVITVIQSLKALVPQLPQSPDSCSYWDSTLRSWKVRLTILSFMVWTSSFTGLGACFLSFV